MDGLLTLRRFLNSLLPQEKARFADAAGTTVGHLAQLCGGHRRASPKLARRMVRASALLFPNDPTRQLTLAAVRPDIWSPQDERSVEHRMHA